MSIPLDCLYHYLESLCSEDILIYRWYPHGSKKLEDLSELGSKLGCEDPSILDVFKKRMITPMMICHDQEPLFYDLYTKEECYNAIKLTDIKKHKIFSNIVADSHLRAATEVPLNFNEYTLLCHSEKNSDQLKLYEKNNFIGVYYWCHAIIARDWYRFAEHDSTLDYSPAQIQTDFLIYNRAWSGTREYRLKFVELLLEYNTLHHCNIRFNPIDLDTHYTQHVFKNQKFKINRFDFENFLEINNSISTDSADYVSLDYKTSAVDIVLETLFDDQRIHLTEKVLRPIACGKPFMLVATPGSLAYLKDYGFKTFNEFIDESYDTIIDPYERLLAVVKEMQRISSLDTKSKEILWSNLHDIANFNKQRFFSKEFHNVVSSEFVKNLRSALQTCKQNRSTRWYRMVTDKNLVPDIDMSLLPSHYYDVLDWGENKIKTDSSQ